MIEDKAKQTLKLIMRSPDQGDGWRNVSKVCWQLIDGFPNKELIEAKQNEDGTGQVRLSEKGEMIVDYL